MAVLLPRNFDRASHGWVETAAEVAQRRGVAHAMEGLTLTRVRYLNIDYVGSDRPGVTDGGPREITEAEEWLEPTWKHDGFHALDWGVDFELAGGGRFHLTWDPPGAVESLRFVRGALFGVSLVQHSSPAIWDVSETDPWRECIGKPVEQVTLVYQPWSPEGGFWCTDVDLRVAGGTIRLTCGDVDIDGRLGPSANTVAVVVPN